MRGVYRNINMKTYFIESGSTVMKYVCESDNFGGKWNHWADHAGAERGTVEDMLSIADDPIEDDTPQTGLAENLEMPDGPWNEPEEFEEMDGGGVAPVLPMRMDGSQDDEYKEEWMAENTPMGGDPVDMEAMYEAHHTLLG